MDQVTRATIRVLVFILVSASLMSGKEPSGLSIPLFRQHLDVLGSDRLNGRGTGTEGELMAARYIAQMLRNSGVKAGVGDDNYFQLIPMQGSRISAESKLTVHFSDIKVDLLLQKDYLVDNAGGLDFFAQPVEMVFVGYGIVAPEFDYSDYQGIDIRGKIAVYLDGEPESDDESFFFGNMRTIYSYPEAKQRIAQSRGALATILIPAKSDEQNWAKWQRSFGFEEVKLAYSAAEILSLIVPANVAGTFFREAGFSLQEAFDFKARGDMRSFPLNSSLHFSGEFSRREFNARNVAGMIPGRNSRLRDEFLLLSAHYDHLGVGSAIDGDSIYNGVFDNAAGVAAVLELARLFAENPPEKSVLFLFVTGEERGLLGSSYYVDHPIVPLFKTIANVNVDGISMFEQLREVLGVGSGLSSLSDYLMASAHAMDMSVGSIPDGFSILENFARSDQISFARAGVPAILVVEGNKYVSTPDVDAVRRMQTWAQTIYHTPFDDLSQSVNYAAVEQHVLLLEHLCRALTNSKEPIVWNSDVRYRVERYRTRAERR
ncbi:MAG: M28 family peptidase [Calditrichia bacterium]